MTTPAEIPVVDLSKYGLGVANREEVDKKAIHTLAEKICGAFSEIGFCYISNHGIPQSQIDEVNDITKNFFEMPINVKKRFQRPREGQDYGWLGLGDEHLNPERPADFKESFNYLPFEKSQIWPDVPGFEKTVKNFFKVCHALALRIFDLISIGLHLEDADFMRRVHGLIGQKGNSSALRTLFYPPIPLNKDIKPNQVRCGEHSDYGSVTLLFQDEVGGLEVCNLAGEYIQATPIPGTVLINIGNMMQRWTGDKLIATKHRVLIPKEELLKRKSRQSIAFFIQPDDREIIQCLDGSEKYKPISCSDYLHYQISRTY